MIATLAAAGSSPATPDLSPLWLQYGAIGVICACLIWFSYRAYRREAERADRKDAEVDRLNQVLRDSEVATRDTVNSMREVIAYLQDEHHPPRKRGS